MHRLHIRAFSLLEMLITLAIVSILLAIAYPSYTQYFLHQKRVRAETVLLKLASALELYYNENNSYQKATLTNLGFQPILSDQSYQLSIELANDREYIISANPMNSQTADTLCGKLSLHSTGEKNSGGSGKYNACW